MSKIVRKVQKIFGLNAGVDEISEYGSLAAGSIVYTTDPAAIQSLSNYLDGWFSAVIGGNSPAIEDMNALCYLFAYQLSYLMQEGIPEWETNTIYFIGSLAQDGNGNIYKSLTDNNTGNALSSTANWVPQTSGIADVAINPATQSPYTMTAGDNGKTFLVNSANGSMTFNLPTAVANFGFFVKDVGGIASSSPITLVPSGGAKIENLAANFTQRVDYGFWAWNCDATNWWET